MSQNCHFILFLNGEFHFADIQYALQLMALVLQVIPPLLLLPSRLITLVKVSPQILDFLILLMVDRSELISGKFHILQHCRQLIHTVSSLSKHISASLVIQGYLGHCALDIVQVAIVLFRPCSHILVLQLHSPPFLIHGVASMLLRPYLTVRVLQLAPKALRDLVLLAEARVEPLVLHHLIRCARAQIGHLRVQLALQIVQPDVLLLLLLVALL